MNDIIVYGYKDDQSDHDANLQAVMERAQEQGLKLNLEKCKVGCTEVPLFGHIISAKGLGLDPKKIQAILNMGPSKSSADL